MKMLCMAVLFVVAFVALPVQMLLAEEESFYSYGTVQKIGSDTLVLDEYDVESDSQNSVIYLMDKDVTLNNVDSIQEIAVGDYLDIEYVKDDKGNNKIIQIDVYEIE